MTSTMADRIARLRSENIIVASRQYCERLLAPRLDELRSLKGRLEVDASLVVLTSQDQFSKALNVLQEYYHGNALGPAVEEVWATIEATTLLDIQKNATWSFKFDELRLQQEAALRASEARMREDIRLRADANSIRCLKQEAWSSRWPGEIGNGLWRKEIHYRELLTSKELRHVCGCRSASVRSHHASWTSVLTRRNRKTKR